MQHRRKTSCGMDFCVNILVLLQDKKIVDNYIVDFLCTSKKLVIEIDGSQHFTDDGLEYDRIRTDLFESLGLHVMRFTNTQIDTSFDEVCVIIQNYTDSHNQ